MHIFEKKKTLLEITLTIQILSCLENLCNLTNYLPLSRSLTYDVEFDPLEIAFETFSVYSTLLLTQLKMQV